MKTRSRNVSRALEISFALSQASTEKSRRTSTNSSNALLHLKQPTLLRWRVAQSPIVSVASSSINSVVVSPFPSSKPRVPASCLGSTTCLQEQGKQPNEGPRLNKETKPTPKTAARTLKLTFEVADFGISE